MNSKTLLFIRHCRSEANEQDILASRIDYPLSYQGKLDARHIAEKINRLYTIEAIISSPLSRAKETAEYIAQEKGIQIKEEVQLIEQDLGIFSGLSYTEIEKRTDYQHDRNKRWLWKPENGESYKEIYERIRDFFERIIDPMDVSTILCVTHAVTMRMVRAFLENSTPLYPKEIAQNGEIWEIQYKGSGKTYIITEHHLIDSGLPPTRA
jgi:broad specificity phosphatase PhoE